MAEGYRAFYRLYAERFGKKRGGDKTPLHAFHIRKISSVLPEAHFVHIIRDGRDVALSLREKWFSPGWEIQTQASHWMNWVQTARSQGADCPHCLEIRYEDLVAHPRATLEAVCSFLQLDFDDRMLCHHERAAGRIGEQKDRVLPDGSLLTREERISKQQRLTTPPDPSRILVWMKTMDPAECRAFEEIAGGLLRELGYKTGTFDGRSGVRGKTA